MSKLTRSDSMPLVKELAQKTGALYWYLALWIVGLLVMVGMSIVIHGHPGIWPIEVDTARLLQGSHPVPCDYRKEVHSWLDTVSDRINQFNDPIPSVIIPTILAVLLILFRRFWQAIWLLFVVASASLLWAGFSDLIGRPRAVPGDGFCVHRVIAAFSFPSGHVTHDMVLYGFLFYLTLLRPAREWRYHWLLTILQVLMVIYVLVVGYARLEAGEHHLFDVLGAYLFSLLWLAVCIVLYHVLGTWLSHHLPWEKARHNIATTLN